MPKAQFYIRYLCGAVFVSFFFFLRENLYLPEVFIVTLNEIHSLAMIQIGLHTLGYSKVYQCINTDESVTYFRPTFNA